MLECIESMLSAIQYDHDFLGVISHDQNNTHRTLRRVDDFWTE